MNGSRILINVAVFVTLAVVMTIWALRNVITFDFVERPYTVTAEFASSPGLHPDFEVAYLGIRVGKIKSIRLDAPGHKVVAELSIDRGVTIPEQVQAAAGRKSAVGEPYVDLAPLPGADLSKPMKEGGKIPLANTSVPVAYGDLFGKLINSLKAIDPASTKTIVHELAEGWEGREDSLRQIIDGTDQITTAFAERSDLIDGLTDDLSALTHTLATHKDGIGSSIDNTAALVGPLASLRAEIKELLNTAPGFTSRLAQVVEESEGNLGCSIEALGSTLSVVGGKDQVGDLRDTLRMADVLQAALADVIKPTSQGNVLNLAFIIKTKARAPLEYKKPLAQPKVGAIPKCANASVDPFKGGPRTVAKDDRKNEAAAKPGVRATESAAPTAAVRNVADDGPSGPPGWLVYVPPVLALLVLLRVMMRAFPTVFWPRRRR